MLRTMSRQFLKSPRMETSEPLWATCASAWSPSQFLPIASGPVTGHHWKEPGSILFAPSLEIFIYIGKIPLCLLFSRLKQSQLSQSFLMWELLQSFHHLGGPSQDSPQCVQASLVLGSPALDTVIQVWPHQCWREGKDHLPWSGGSSLFNAAQDFAFFAGACSTSCPPRSPGCFFTSHFPAGQPPACAGAWGCSPPGAGLCTSPCWTAWRSHQPISTACPGPSGWQYDSGVSAPPPSLVSSANLLRVCSAPPSRSLMKMFNRIRAWIDPCSTPVVTDLQLRLYVSDHLPLEMFLTLILTVGTLYKSVATLLGFQLTERTELINQLHHYELLMRSTYYPKYYTKYSIYHVNKAFWSPA